MNDERGSSATTGCVIAAVVAALLMVCGGGVLVAAGLLFFRATRSYSAPAPPPPAAVAAPAAHVDVLAIDADGSLLWNGEPIQKPDLARRLDELKSAPPPPRSVIVRVDPQAPLGTADEFTQQLTDRGLGYILENGR